MTISTETLKNTIETLGARRGIVPQAQQKYGLFGKQKVFAGTSQLTRTLMGLSPPPPETPEEIAKLKDALTHISSDVRRGNGSIFDRQSNPVDDYWLGVIWAGASLGWSGGQEIFRQWSMQSSRYDDQGFEKAWNSYDPIKLNAIGIGSLYKLAMLKGWNQQPRLPAVLTTSVGTDTNQALVPVLDPTDAGNASWLNRYFQGKVRWVHEDKRWLCFDEYSGWVATPMETMMRLAEEGIRSLGQAGYQTMGADDLKALTKHVNRSLNAPPIANALTLLKGQPGVLVKVAELDKDPMLLGVAEGLVIDLRTGTMRKQVTDDLITKSAHVDYDPIASCPTFGAFLNSIFQGDRDLIDFLQRWVGYTLTGLTNEQQVLFAFGYGANGKSVLFSVLTEILGDYAIAAPVETFMLSSNGEGAKSHLLARLAGARLAIANETSDGQRLAEGLIKEATGGETIAAAHKYGHVFEYQPTFKLAIVGNHKPVIRGMDDGIWRRLQLLPFTRKFELHEQDPQLKYKLLDERSGILNWAIKGCLAWQKEGRLSMPPVMQAEVAQYRSESDIIGLWLEDRCDHDPSAATTASLLFTSYDLWCKSNGHKPASATTLGRWLSERGYQRRRGKQTEWIGIRFKQGSLFDG